MCSTSQKPSVRSSAVGRPLRSISTLVTIVVACTTIPSTSRGPIPAAFITFATPAKNPSSRSWGVVSTLSMVSTPEECRSTMSVKVPPISTAREYVTAPSSFRLAKNPGRPEEQEDQQDRQRRYVLQPGPEREHRQRLREPQRNAAEERAERPSEPADDGGDESGDRKRRADIECRILGRRQQDAGDRAKGGAERKRKRQHAR